MCYAFFAGFSSPLFALQFSICCLCCCAACSSSSSLCLSFCSLPCAVCGSRRTCCMPHAVLSLQQEVARPMTKPETEPEPETEPCRRVATKTRWDRLDSTAGTHTHTHKGVPGAQVCAARSRRRDCNFSTWHSRSTFPATTTTTTKIFVRFVSFSFCSLA